MADQQGATANMFREWANKQNEEFEPSGKVPRWTQFPNRRGALLLTCMDPRVNPHEIWPLKKNPIGIVRNAGGRAGEFLRSAEVLTAAGKQPLGAVCVIHHTDCGLLNYGNQAIRDEIESHSPHLTEDQLTELKSKEFGELNTDIDESVREDMRIIKNDPFLPKDLEVVGFVYDSFTGKIYEVEAFGSGQGDSERRPAKSVL